MKRNRIFLAPDGAPSGAVLESTIEPATVDLSTFDFTPPSSSEYESFIDGKAEAPPSGKVTAKEKPVDSPADDLLQEQPKIEEPKKPEPPKAEEKPKPEPASQLRGRLKELETERDTLKADLEAARSTKEIDAIRAELAENKAAREAAEKQSKDYENRLLTHNPLVSKELTALRDKFNADYKEVMSVVPDLAPKYQALVNQFARLPRDTPEYAAALRDFKDTLRDEFPDDFSTAFDAVRKGAQFQVDHATLAQKVQEDAGKIYFQEQKREWEESSGRVDKEWDTWFTPPTDAERADPYNEKLFLKNFISEVMPEAEASRIQSRIREFVKNATAGAQPRSQDDFLGLSPEAAKAEMAKIEQNVNADRAKLPEALAIGLMSKVTLKPLIAEISRLRARLAEKEGSAPPDPTKQDGVADRGDENDITKWTPPRPSI